MKKYIAVVVVLLILVEIYGYIQNPVACKKLWSDLAVDVPAILTPTDATKTAFSTAVSSKGVSLLAWATGGGSTNAAPLVNETNAPAATPPSGTAIAPTTASTAEPGAGTTSAPTGTTAAAPVVTTTVAPPAPVLPIATPEQQAALAAWKEPTSIPSNADWKWTTSKGTFTDVQIVRVEADAVTIIHHDGGALVPISELPQDLQKQLNYDPQAAAAAAAKRAADEAAVAAEKAKEQQPPAASLTAPVAAAPAPRNL